MIAHSCTPGNYCALCAHNQKQKPAAPKRQPLQLRGPCEHLGKRLEFRAGCGGWRCEHECEAGEPVAVPGGVCQSCPKWTAPGTPEPPDISGSRIVCTVATGGAADLLEATEPLMRRYASKVGADFHAFTGPAGAYPLADKFRVHHLTSRYDRLLFVDADALIHPDTPDLFEQVPAGVVAVFDDAPYVSVPFKPLIAEVAESQGLTHTRDRVLNTGVVLWKRDQPGWQPPTKPLPTNHVSEQCWVQINIERNNLPIHLLPREWNHQWWSDRSLEHADRAHILHLAGMSQSDTVPGWKLTPAAYRTTLLRAAAWAATRRS